MAARYRRDFMGDEAEDNVFRRKPYEVINHWKATGITVITVIDV